jgi:hypothetical protein
MEVILGCLTILFFMHVVVLACCWQESGKSVREFLKDFNEMADDSSGW